MINLQSLMQTRNGITVIHLSDFANYIGRKEYSIVNAISKIPDDCLDKNLYIIQDNELYLSARGIYMLNMNARHATRIIKVIMQLNNHYEVIVTKIFEDLKAHFSNKTIFSLFMLFSRYKPTYWIANMMYKYICYVKKQDLMKYANIGKDGAA